MTLRSFLFVPGSSERKLAKASGFEADALILDLEDSVRDAFREEARSLVADHLRVHASEAGAELWVRVNGLGTDWVDEDLAAVAVPGLAGIVMPKVRGPEDIRELDRRITEIEKRAGLPGGGIRILAVATETPGALFRLGDYAGCSARLWGLTWGAEDLSAAVGASENHDRDGAYDPLYRLARTLCLAGARAAGVEPIDGVFTDFQDLEGLAAEALDARRQGFTAKIAIHPGQVETIQRAFTPSEVEIEHARTVVAAFAEHPDAGAVSLDGEMLDRPHYERALQILGRAKAAGLDDRT